MARRETLNSENWKRIYPSGRGRFAAAGGVVCLALAALLLPGAVQAAPMCQPGLVRRDGGVVPVNWHPAPLRAAAPQPGTVRIRYLAHSSFVITSPDGTRVLTDPYFDFSPKSLPDAVTVSNFHETHTATGPFEGKVPIIYGAREDGSGAIVNRLLQGIRIFGYPQAMAQSAPPYYVNTIFVFKAGGLCIAHFGNARLGPSPQQIRALGKIHVMMLPIDGMWTVPHEVAAQLARRIGPNVLIPMHFLGPELPSQFAAALQTVGIDRIRRAKKSEIAISLRRLPPPTTYMVLPNDEFP